MNSDNAGRRPFRRIYVLPSLLTMGNFACGFFAIAICLKAAYFAAAAGYPGQNGAEVAPAAVAAAALVAGRRDADRRPGEPETLYWACLLVLIGMLFDVLDGKVARHVGAASAFGTELDSLADVVTFGLAPPVLVNVLWMSARPPDASWLGLASVFGAVFALSAALRLARYNILSSASDKNVFTGMPSPAAAGCVVTAVLLFNGDYAFVEAVCRLLSELGGGGMTVQQAGTCLLAAFLLVPGVLMVTAIPFTHLANRYFTGKKPFSILVAALLILPLIWLEPRVTLFAGFNGYLLAGLILAARKRWRRSDVRG